MALTLRRVRISRLWLIGTVTGLIVAVAAGGGMALLDREESASDEAARRLPASFDAPQLVVDGQIQPLPDRVSLGNDLEAIFRFIPGDLPYTRTLTIALVPSGGTDASGAATIRAEAAMRLMADHGSVAAEATPVGDGAYSLPLPFLMPGGWEIAVEIVADGERATVDLYLEVWT